MNYVSTRGGTEKVSGAYAIKKGLCDNGGLFMPEYIPTISKEDIDTLCTYTYAQRAAYIMGLYLDEYKDILPALCEKAYSEERFGKDPAVLKFFRDIESFGLQEIPVIVAVRGQIFLTDLLSVEIRFIKAEAADIQACFLNRALREDLFIKDRVPFFRAVTGDPLSLPRRIHFPGLKVIFLRDRFLTGIAVNADGPGILRHRLRLKIPFRAQ